MVRLRGEYASLGVIFSKRVLSFSNGYVSKFTVILYPIFLKIIAKRKFGLSKKWRRANS